MAFTFLSDFAIVDSLLHGEVEVSALDAAIVDICEGIIESCDECVVMAESGGGGWEAVYGTEVVSKILDAVLQVIEFILLGVTAM